MYVTSTKAIMDAAKTIVREDFVFQAPATVKQVAVGQPLFHEGDRANTIYQIISGVVRTSKLLSNGKRQIISFCYPGDLVGLSPDSVYHTECEAVSDVQLRVIRKNAAGARFDDEPQIGDLLLRYAAMEVAGMQEHFLMLGCKSATEKVASFLVSLAHRSGQQEKEGITISLPMKRADIADYLGVTIETVSRTFTKLKTLGVISLPGPHQVCVTDMTALKKVSENA